MANYNRVIMIGNLTRDPELKTIASGQSVCRLGLASNRQFKNRQTGNLVQEVCYVDIDVWGAQAESCQQYLQKGRAVLVEGRLKFDTWADPNGQNRSKHSIVADRVVFLASNLNAETTEGVGQSLGSTQQDPSSQLEKELLDQIEEIKGRTAKTAKTEAKAPKAKPAVRAAEAKGTPAPAAANKPQTDDPNQVGDVAFKDEPPFQDDLPF